MKTCKLCGSTYGDKVDFCFRDGQPLVISEQPPPATDAPTPRNRPGLADMLDVPEPGYSPVKAAVDLPSPGVPASTDLPGPTDLPDAVALPDSAGLAATAGFSDAAALPDPGALVGSPEPLAPPSPLAPPDPTAPVPLPAPSLGDVDSQRDDDAFSGRSATAEGMEMIPEDDLPPARPLVDTAEEQTLADLARNLGGQDAAPDVDEFIDQLPSSVDDSDPDADLFYDPVEPAPRSNRTLMMMFGGALIVLVCGIAYILLNRGDKVVDPLAGKPEEVAAPVVVAPALPNPKPVPPPPPVIEDVAAEPTAAGDVGTTPAWPAFTLRGLCSSKPDQPSTDPRGAASSGAASRGAASHGAASYGAASYGAASCGADTIGLGPHPTQ
ncbi:MAG: hypothetical protein GXP62_08035 [Oligoflexia bacterium]|nr:hypothetical protein [Oligoflexia bacterium]